MAFFETWKMMIDSAKKIFYVAMALLVAESSVQAASSSWEGDNVVGFGTDLSQVLNWSTGFPSNSGDVATFDNSANVFVGLLTGGGNDLSLGQVDFNSATYEIEITNGATLDILNGVDNAGGSSVQFFANQGTLIFEGGASSDSGATFNTMYHIEDNSTVQFKEDSTGNGIFQIVGNGTASTLELNGNSTTVSIGSLETDQFSMTVLGNNNLILTAPGVVKTIAGPITGSTGGSLTLDAPGSDFTISNPNNNFTKGANLINGTLTLGGDGVFPAADDLTIGANGSLDVGAFQNTVGSLSGSGTITIETGTLSIGGKSFYAGDISGSGEIIINPDGEVTFSGDNTYIGLTTIDGPTGDLGTLNVGSTTGLSPSSAYDVSGLLNLNDFSSTIAGLTGGSDGGAPNGIINTGTLNTTTLTIGDGSTARTDVYSGAIQGAGNIDIQTFESLVLTGTNNTYSGTTTVEADGSLLGGATNSFSSASALTNFGFLNLSDGTNDFSNTIGSLFGSGMIILGETGGTPILTIGNGVDITTSSFSGDIEGPGGIDIPLNSTVTFSGNNTYVATTSVEGTLNLGSTTAYPTNSQLIVDGTVNLNDFSTTIPALFGSGSVDTGILDTTTLTVTTAGTFSGYISGAGNLAVSSGGVLNLLAPSTYTGTTALRGSLVLETNGALPTGTDLTLLVGMSSFGNFDMSQASASSSIGTLTSSSQRTSIDLGSNTLTINETSPTTYAGVIDGTGGLIKTGTETLTLSGNLTYTGPTTVSAGTLNFAGRLATQALTLSPSTTVQFSNLAPLNLTTTLVGPANSTLNVTGALVNLTGNASGFLGDTLISGVFGLNTAIGGNVFVQSGGFLQGTGTVDQNLSVQAGGTVAPGSSSLIGTLSVLENYTQEPNSFYDVLVSGAQSSLIDVTGTATLQGGEVVVAPGPGGIKIDQTYQILAAGNVSGEFSGVTATDLNGNSGLFMPELFYTPTGVFFELTPNLVFGASTHNQLQVAIQIDGLTDPNPFEISVINALVNLPIDQIGFALDSLSGEQYAEDLFANQILGRQFIRRLYDPLRPLVTSVDSCNSCCESNFEIWFEGGAGRAYQRNQLGNYGLKIAGEEVTLGIQKTFGDWTIGLAGSYEHDYIHYNLAGSSQLDCGLVGLYGLYRPDCFYILGDVVYGYSSNKLNRPVEIGALKFSATSRPEISSLDAYIEGGIDLIACGLLFQPFVGFEVDSYWRDAIHESGFVDFGLNVRAKSRTAASSRLGFHLTKASSSGFALYVDAAWDCLMTTRSNIVYNQFQGFGTTMAIEGVRPERNSVDGAITFAQTVSDNVFLFVEVEGQLWAHSSAYAASIGLITSW